MKLGVALVLLAACGKDEPRKQEPIKPPVQELDRLPDEPPAAKPKQPQPSLDQVLSCFSDPIVTDVPQSISSITAADFDRDGRNDIVLTYETLDNQVFTGHVVTYRNTGDGRLREHASIKAGDMTYAVSAGDIDKDGNVDLAVGDPRGAKTRLYAGNGDGSFTEKPAIAGRKSYGATLVDLDGDGTLDMITEMFSDVAIWKGDGKFGFKRRAVIDTGQAPDGPIVADFDGDKVVDLGYVANDEAYLFLLKGPAYKPIHKGATCDQGGYNNGGDIDDDGDFDMVYVCDDKIELQLNDGKGNFKSVHFPYGPSEDPVAIGDLTRDGKTDLLVSHRLEETTSRLVPGRSPEDGFHSQLTLLEGLGNGEWREAATGRMFIINAVKVADMDGDQKLDIVVATWSGNKAALVVLLRQDC